jgi:hypothetical protein
MLIWMIQEQAASDVEESLQRWIATNSPESELNRFAALPIAGPWYDTVQVSLVLPALAVLAGTALMCKAVAESTVHGDWPADVDPEAPEEVS